MGTWSVSASLLEWYPWVEACGTEACSLPPGIKTQTRTQTSQNENMCHSCNFLRVPASVCAAECFQRLWINSQSLGYLYEGVEARLFFLPALDLVQGPRLVTAEPRCQLLEPLPLRTTKLAHSQTHTHKTRQSVTVSSQKKRLSGIEMGRGRELEEKESKRWQLT